MFASLEDEATVGQLKEENARLRDALKRLEHAIVSEKDGMIPAKHSILTIQAIKNARRVLGL